LQMIIVMSWISIYNYDKFREHRRELVELRCNYFGEDSKLCKNERKNFR